MLVCGIENLEYKGLRDLPSYEQALIAIRGW